MINKIMTKAQIKKAQKRLKHLWKYFEDNDAFSGEDCSMIEELIEIAIELNALDGQSGHHLGCPFNV